MAQKLSQGVLMDEKRKEQIEELKVKGSDV